MHLTIPADHYIPSGRPTPADIAAKAATDGATTDHQTWHVAVALTNELREHHHPYIPTATVRAACFQLLHNQHAEGSWDDRANATYVTIEQRLLDGALYEQAEREGVTTTTTRIGRVISQTAADRLRVTPGRRVWEVVEEAHSDTLDRVLDWIDSTTTLNTWGSDTYDHIPAEAAAALLQHLTAVPAERIGSIAPSQVLADARAAGARPEHVLDAVAVAITSVLTSATGRDFHGLLPDVAADVRESAHGWLDETLDLDADEDGFTYGELSDDQVAGMLDHVAKFVREYDVYADHRSEQEVTISRRVRPRDRR